MLQYFTALLKSGFDACVGSDRQALLQEVVIVGGLEMQNQAKALARRPHVVVATPGRLKVNAIPSV